MADSTPIIIHPSRDADSSADLVMYAAPPPGQHPAEVYLQDLSSLGSQRTMRTALNTIAMMLGVPAQYAEVRRPTGTIRQDNLTYLACNWAALRYHHTSKLRALLIQRYAIATVNTHLAALRGVIRAAWRLGLMSAEAYHRATDIADVRGKAPLRGRALEDAELPLLIYESTAAEKPIDIRDRAILILMLNTAVRRSELAGIVLADYQYTHPGADTHALRITKAKRRKVRTVYVDHNVAQVITSWLNLRGLAPGPLFCRVDRWGHLHTNNGLGSQGIYNMIRKRSAVLNERISPHDLRRSALTKFLEIGVDPLTVTKIAGHESTKTTADYDYRGKRHEQDASRAWGQRLVRRDDTEADSTPV